jgi:hypothetical protein
VLITVTVAPETTAPEASVTVPEMVPVAAVCAQEGTAAEITRSAAAAAVTRRRLHAEIELAEV